MMKTLKLWPGETALAAKAHARISSPTPRFPVQLRGAQFLQRRLNATDGVPTTLPLPSGSFRENSSASIPRRVDAATIYLVDDTEGLTELYTLFLKGTSYVVRAFEHRAEVLAALTADREKPDLLIMDYFGHSMPVDRFMQRCRVVRPSLRILMASGLSESDIRFSCARPDRFIQKPFTAEEFLQEVRATLAATLTP